MSVVAVCTDKSAPMGKHPISSSDTVCTRAKRVASLVVQKCPLLKSVSLGMYRLLPPSRRYTFGSQSRLRSVPSGCQVVVRANNTLGLPGRFSSRVQPNHPTDDVEGILAGLVDGAGYTDVHAQLRPVFFREPSVNLGVGSMRGNPPHLVARAFLDRFGIRPDSVWVRCLPTGAPPTSGGARGALDGTISSISIRRLRA